MLEPDYTLTSPLSSLARSSPPLLALTILWHPDPARIGEQFLGPAGPGSIALSRYLPLFQAPGGPALALGQRVIARTPIQLRRCADDALEIALPDSRMAVELNGVPVHGCVRAEVGCGLVLSLGGAVLLCAHWMRELPQFNPVPSLLGVSSAAVRLRALIAQAAPTELPVLLLGETGSGKEVAAQAIHRASSRAGAPLVAVNMAALNEALAAADLFGAAKGAYTGAHAARPGLFAEAAGGTLFLDEIGDTPASVQPMLLRVLESSEYRPLGASADRRSTARLIAATDQNLQARAFSQPLLRRLEAFVIEVPSLRERRADIGLLIAHFLGQELCPVLPTALVGQMCRHHWPGNVRQLGNVVRRIAICLRAGELPDFDALAGPPLAPSGMPAGAATTAVAAAPARVSLAGLSEQAIVDALQRHGWEIQGAALQLGISRSSLYKLLEQHPRIRRAEAIPIDEIQAALKAGAGDLGRCAARLQTPREALRRYLRSAGLAR